MVTTHLLQQAIPWRGHGEEAVLLAAALVCSLASPPTHADSLALRSVLLRYAGQLTRFVHRAQGPCRRRGCACTTGRLEAAALAVWMDDHDDPRQTFADWARDYARQIAAHPGPVSARVASLLEKRLAGPPGLAEVAKTAGISRTLMSTAFKADYGVTPFEYHTRLRLRRAVALLREGEKAREVARQSGYRSHKNFNLALREYTGLTPTAVRYADGETLAGLLAGALDVRSQKNNGHAASPQAGRRA